MDLVDRLYPWSTTASAETSRADEVRPDDRTALPVADGQPRVGDRITVHGLHVGDATRVLEVKGAGGEPPYVVRWDDGHEAVFVPGSGVRVDAAGAAPEAEFG